MARDHARVNVTIWNDPDFRALPPAAQHLYLVLWTSPGLSYCGSHDWRPARMTGLFAGFRTEHVETVAACLEARHFLVVDRETEEALIRSWMRFDGLMKQPRMAISCVMAYAQVGSPDLRRVVVHEMRKIRDEAPGLPCWTDKRVAEVLSHDAVSAKGLPVPKDPFGDEVGSGLDMGLPQTEVGFGDGFRGPLLLTPTPTPYSLLPGTSGELLEEASEPSGKNAADAATKKISGKKPARRLPDDWKPTTKHWERRRDGIDVEREAEKFRLHAEANDRRQANWNASFSQWLLNARPTERPARSVTNLPLAHMIEEPPPGLDAREYDEWFRAQAAKHKAADQ